MKKKRNVCPLCKSCLSRKHYLKISNIWEEKEEFRKELSNLMVNALSKETNEIKSGQKKEEINFLKQKGDSIPIHIFKNDTLSALESIVKYLKENKKLKNSKIAKKLNRNPKTIWATYHKAKQKQSKIFKEQETSIKIPIKIFSNRNLSILEHIIKHLKEYYHLRNVDISKLLNRSSKTIWTTYHNADSKRG